MIKQIKTYFVLALVAFSFTAHAQDDDESESADVGKYGSGQDSVKCVENLSLYSEYYKQKNYKDAKKFWVQAISICPQSSKNLYIYGSNMYKKFIKAEKDKATKQGLVDTLMMIYDMRMEHFGQEAYVKGKKGSDMLKYGGGTEEESEALLKFAVENLGNEADAGVIAYYYNAVYRLHKDGKRTQADMITLYPKLMAIVSHNEKAGKGKKYLKAKESIDEIFQAVADCESLIPFYRDAFTKNPEDVELLKEMTSILEKKSCTDDPLFYEAASKLAALEPSASAYYNLGIVAIKQEKWAEAATNFETAADQEGGDAETIEKALINGSKANLKLGRYSKAASLARRAGEVNPKNGEVHLLIADAYAYSAGSCGDNDCTAKSAYWVAYDEVLKAKAVDPSLADKVNQKAGGYKANFPDSEKCFFHSITEGSQYTVGCWINRSTTVRFK